MDDHCIVVSLHAPIYLLFKWNVFIFEIVWTLSALHSWFVLMRSCFSNITLTLFVPYFLSPYCLLFVLWKSFDMHILLIEYHLKWAGLSVSSKQAKISKPSAVNCEWMIDEMKWMWITVLMSHCSIEILWLPNFVWYSYWNIIFSVLYKSIRRQNRIWSVNAFSFHVVIFTSFVSVKTFYDTSIFFSSLLCHFS